MITIYTSSSPAGFAMPISWSDAVSAAAVRTFPTAKRRVEGVVCAHTQQAAAGFGDVAVLDDATFPGASAWSPPI